MTVAVRSPAVRIDNIASAHRGIVRLAGTFELSHGGHFTSPQIAYEVVGPATAPVLMVLGGISANRHVTSSQQYPKPGWWEEFAGPGKPLDTRRYRILSMDFLGGNGATEGPRTTDRPMPSVAPDDQARLVNGLLDLLNISNLRAFVGASYGGMVALQFAALFPERLQQQIIIGAAHKAPAIATALRTIQREAIRSASRLGSPEEGLRIARAIGMVTYRSAAEFDQRFSDVPEKTDGALKFPVENYLFSQGNKFASQFHPEAVLCLSESIDLQQLSPESIKVPTELFCARSDFVAPPALMLELADRLAGPVNYTEFDSLYGHDSFLKELDLLGNALRRLLKS